MALIYLHLVNVLILAATAAAFHLYPHLWRDQGVVFLAMSGAGAASLAVVAVGCWAMMTRQAGFGKVALNALLALIVAAGAGYYAYRVGLDYNLIAYMRAKLR